MWHVLSVHIFSFKIKIKLVHREICKFALVFDALTYKSYLDMQVKSIKGWNFNFFLCHLLSYHIFIVNILVKFLELFWAKNDIILCFQFPCHLLLCYNLFRGYIACHAPWRKITFQHKCIMTWLHCQLKATWRHWLFQKCHNYLYHSF